MKVDQTSDNLPLSDCTCQLWIDFELLEISCSLGNGTHRNSVMQPHSTVPGWWHQTWSLLDGVCRLLSTTDCGCLPQKEEAPSLRNGRWCVSSLHYTQVCFADEPVRVGPCVFDWEYGDTDTPVSSIEISKNCGATLSGTGDGMAGGARMAGQPHIA